MTDMPTFNINEVFPETAKTANPVAQFTANVTNLDDGRIHLAAFYGTEAYGRITGVPLGLTDFGTVSLTAVDKDGAEVTILITSEAVADALRDALRTACNVAENRDVRNDQRSQE